MNQEQLATELSGIHADTLNAMAQFYGPKTTADIFRAWADILDAMAVPRERLN